MSKEVRRLRETAVYYVFQVFAHPWTTIVNRESKINGIMASADIMMYDSEEDTTFQRRPNKNRPILSDSDDDTPSTNEDKLEKDKSSESEVDDIQPETNGKKKRVVRVENSENDAEEKLKPKRIVASKQKFKDILYNKLHKKKSKDGDRKTAKHKPKDDKTSQSGFESDGKSSPNSSPVQKSANQFSNKDLYDAETSEGSAGSGVDEENINDRMEHEETNYSQSQKANKKNEKRPSKPAQRKSSSDALEKIHAETQRLIRESSVSLPYFLPKPRSISEFLEKRKPIPAIPLRAKGESLGSYIHQYEERVKSIKETYQQMEEDDENEENNDQQKKNDKENITNNLVENKNAEMTVGESEDGKQIESVSKENVDSTQKEMASNDNSNEHVNKEMIGKDIHINKDVEMSDASIERVSEVSGKSKETNDEINCDSIDDSRCNINDNDTGTLSTNEIKNTSDETDVPGEDMEENMTNEFTSNSETIENIDRSNEHPSEKSRLVDSQVSQTSPNETGQMPQTETGSRDDISETNLQTKNVASKTNQHSAPENSKSVNEKQVNSFEANQKNESDRSKGIQQKCGDSQQGSECNIFSNLTESELMEEMEYAEEMCEDISMTKSSNPVVKKKLFADWTDTIRAPSDDEDHVQAITLKPSLDDKNNKFTDFIELDDVKPSSRNLKPGVLKLMQRFQKHVSTKAIKPATKKTVSLNITTTERDSQGEITGVATEALSIVLEDNSELDSSKHGAQCKPGAKLVKLKETLDKEMTRRREEAWKRRIEEAKMNEETYEGEKSDCGADEDEEFDEDEEEITTEEEEEEEIDMKRKKKKRVKSDFVDEEALMDNEKETELEKKGEEQSLKVKSKTFDMFMSQKNDEMECDDEDELPGYQRGVAARMSTPAHAHDKVVLSPVVTLTGCDKMMENNLQDSSFLLDSQTPSSPNRPHHSPKMLNFEQEELHADPTSDIPTQGNGLVGGLDLLLPTQGSEELEGLFSGKFPSQNINAACLEANDEEGDFDTQTQAVPQGVGELVGTSRCPSNLTPALCSGAFTSQPLDPKQLELNDGPCDRFLLTDSLSTAGEQDTQTGSEPPQRAAAAPNLLLNRSSILSSDEEEDELNSSANIGLKPKVKRRKRLVYSDEEEEDNDNEDKESEGEENNEKEDEEEEEEEEEEKGEDGVEGGETEMEGEEEGGEVDYDSEENEVVKKVDDFFDAEAELSESEWGSADEDENDEMDKMEQEEADNEYHDTDKLKEELGKIHMRQQMDDDNREVKLLQEMLLEDGELHSEGPGRQRQFKWSNLDDNSDLRMTAALSGDSEPEDDNGEEKQEDEAWRKARLDRELFLESQKDKLELHESLEEDAVNLSELTKTVILNDLKTKPIAARIELKPSTHTNAAGLPTKSPDSKLHALMGLHKKRGSYLSRGNQSMVRLAKIMQGVGNEDSKIVKKKGNFVFSAVDPEPVVSVGGTNEAGPEVTPRPDSKVVVKRKKSVATPPLLKKLKLNDGSKSSILSKLMTSSDF
ncbi:hypothetical protein WDU94_013585 [Cyamophila willieti]